MNVEGMNLGSVDKSENLLKQEIFNTQNKLSSRRTGFWYELLEYGGSKRRCTMFSNNFVYVPHPVTYIIYWFYAVTQHDSAIRRSSDKSLAFPVSYFRICSTTKKIFLVSSSSPFYSISPTERG
jgi:hypothetical protein